MEIIYKVEVYIGGVFTTSSEHKTLEEAEGMRKCWGYYVDNLDCDPALWETKIVEVEPKLKLVK